MLDHTTVSKLREMKMGVMASAFHSQLGDSAFHGLSFEERVGLMVDAEWSSRQNNRLSRCFLRYLAFFKKHRRFLHECSLPRP